MNVPDKKLVLQQVLSAIENLPPMPENIVKMRKVCANPDASFVDLVPIIESDPGFCADILHIANSAYYGLRHTVESVREAVRYMGFNSVVDYLAVSFSKKVVRSEFSSIKNLEEYFVHSNSIALATKCLAKAAGRSAEVQEFYTIAGLLHDVGRLVILMVSDPQIQSYIGDLSESKPELSQEEYNLLGVDHCFIGKQICEKWQFSEELQTAILRHHTPIKEPFCKTAAFIMLAHFIAMEDFPISRVVDFYPPETSEKMGIDADMVNRARSLYFEETGR